MNTILNSIDILVQPSRMEGLGVAMIEAMACAKPVIGTCVGGIPEVIGDNEGGILINNRAPEELAKAIIYLLKNPALAHKIGLNGRSRVERLFNIYTNVAELEKIYFDLLRSIPNNSYAKS